MRRLIWDQNCSSWTPHQVTSALSPTSLCQSHLSHVKHHVHYRKPSFTQLLMIISLILFFPLKPSSGRYFYDLLPPTPSTPNTDFTHFYNNLRERERVRDALQATASPTCKEAPEVLPVSPPATPATSSPSSSPRRQQRPVLYVKTSSPVGTSAPPPTPALPTPSTPQFRPSARMPKRPVLPAWPVQYCPPAVVV
ncbi:hypothetical protein BGW80DRAFT_900403 [Lactifluus volemus]|nr:hypothetical protein BGW80DRAFT_900403 [Lactifluus volemus]